MEINQQYLGGLSLLKRESDLSNKEKEKLDQVMQNCVNTAKRGEWKVKVILTTHEVDYYKQYFTSLGLKVSTRYLEKLSEYVCELSWRF